MRSWNGYECTHVRTAEDEAWYDCLNHGDWRCKLCCDTGTYIPHLFSQLRILLSLNFLFIMIASYSICDLLNTRNPLNQLAHALGCTVISTSSSDAKLDQYVYSLPRPIARSEL